LSVNWLPPPEPGEALELSPKVLAYVKNDRLDFEILYEWQGKTHKYLPDFLARVEAPAGEVTLVLEVKGHEREQDREKYAAAEKWVRAVNHHGGFGRWAFLVCRDPNRVREMIAELAKKAA
jgi:type III restriction enzyme